MHRRQCKYIHLPASTFHISKPSIKQTPPHIWFQCLIQKRDRLGHFNKQSTCLLKHVWYNIWLSDWRMGVIQIFLVFKTFCTNLVWQFSREHLVRITKNICYIPPRSLVHLHYFKGIMNISEWKLWLLYYDQKEFMISS